MKFLTYVALIGGIAAVKLASHNPKTLIKLRDDDLEAEVKHGVEELCAEAGLSPDDCHAAVEKDAHLAEEALKEHGLLQMKAHAKARKALVMIKNKLKDEDWPELSPEQEKEIEDWVKSELANGGTITKDEAAAALQDFADTHGFEITDEMWEEAEAAFDYVDKNGDGAIDMKELEKALKKHAPEALEIQLNTKSLMKLKSKLRDEDWPELSPEQEKEIKDWVKSELANGGTITKQEAHDALAGFAADHGFTITDDMWKEAEMAFDYVDADGNGEITWPELEAALKEHAPEHLEIQLKGKSYMKLKNKLKSKLRDEDWPELSPEQEKEIEDWVKSELANGGTITKEEAHDALAGFAADHGFTITDDMWAEAEAAFDYVDANGDGAIDMEELEAVLKAHGPPKEGKVQLKTRARRHRTLVQIKNKMKSKLRDEDWPELTEEQWKEIEDWVKSELADGGTITKDEAAAALQEFADAHGFEITDAMWEEAEAAFDYVDANGDGAIDFDELEAVMEEHEPKKGKGKKH